MGSKYNPRRSPGPSVLIELTAAAQVSTKQKSVPKQNSSKSAKLLNTSSDSDITFVKKMA